ncbi:MAG: TetR/AcrR family transcriptional regulator [Marinobacter sp.]
MTGVQRHILDTALRHFADTGEQSISVSDLSRTAKIARGTIYNNFDDVTNLFPMVTEQVCSRFENEARELISTVENPRVALSVLLGLFLRYAHELPEHGRFLIRFAPYIGRLRDIWSNLPYEVLRRAVEEGQLPLAKDQAVYYLQLLAGSTYGFMTLVVEGQKSWRESTEALSLMVLAACGVPQQDAKNDAREALEILTASSEAV